MLLVSAIISVRIRADQLLTLKSSAAYKMLAALLFVRDKNNFCHPSSRDARRNYQRIKSAICTLIAFFVFPRSKRVRRAPRAEETRRAAGCRDLF